MILPIDSRYRLAGGHYGWVVQKRRRRKDRKTGKHIDDWSPIMWFAAPKQAVEALANLMLRTSDVQTLAEALAELEKVSATLSQALAPKFGLTLAKPSLDQENVTARLSQADAQEKEATG